MDRVKTATVSNAREFFAGELKNVLQKHRISAANESFEYLVGLLVRHIEADQFFVKNSQGKLEENFLVDLYSEYVQGSVEKKKIVLQRLGDICLLVSGFFAESLHRKVVDVGYYFGMGGTAYHNLAQMQMSKMMRGLYGELSEKFRPFSNALGEMSERSGLQSNTDILRMYERWLFTGSDRLRTILSEQGIAVPVKIDVKSRH
jgi:hypothetical protein